MIAGLLKALAIVAVVHVMAGVVGNEMLEIRDGEEGQSHG
jgi:hypothetical protein